MAKKVIENSGNPEGVAAVEVSETAALNSETATPVSESAVEVSETAMVAENTGYMEAKLNSELDAKKIELAELDFSIEAKKAELSELDEAIEAKKAELAQLNEAVDKVEEEVEIDFNCPTIRHNGIQYSTKQLEKDFSEGKAEAIQVIQDLIKIGSGAITIKKKGE